MLPRTSKWNYDIELIESTKYMSTADPNTAQNCQIYSCVNSVSFTCQLQPIKRNIALFSQSFPKDIFNIPHHIGGSIKLLELMGM